MTSLYMTLFQENQTYSEAKNVPCWMLEEIIETKLDESLSSLDEDKVRPARETIKIETEFGDMKSFIAFARSKFGELKIEDVIE